MKSRNPNATDFLFHSFYQLKDFKARIIYLHEMDAILRGVADCVKEDIRAGVDIAARMRPGFSYCDAGFPLKAEQIAAQIKNEISERVKRPAWLFEALLGLPSTRAPEEFSATTSEVDELIRVATARAAYNPK
jgi:hypothetical protein